jgi:hypothetical protein
MKAFIVFLLLFLAAFVAWPYYHVWRLDQAVVQNDRRELAELVEIKAVRKEIERRLNKEVNSAVGEVSNAFVDWLQDGIRRMGAEAVNRLVTLEWVREQLLSKTGPQDPPGFIDQISYAFFDSPTGFLVRIGELGEEPVHFRLSLHAGAWRMTALYN